MAGILADGHLPACPECGWKPSARQGRSFFRSRRRKGWAAVACVLAACAMGCALTPRVRRDGPWSLAPTWLLLKAAKWQGTPRDGVAATLLDRLAHGDAWARVAEGVYADNPRLHLLRDAWVEGVSVRGRWSSNFVGGTTLGHSLYLDPSRLEEMKRNDADPTTNQSHENWWYPDVQIVEPAGGSGHERRFAVCVQAVNHCALAEGPAPFFVTVQMKKSIDEVMHPVSIEGLRLFGLLNPRVFVLPTTNNLAVSVGDILPDSLDPHVAVGLRAELLLGEKVIARARWYQGSASRTMTGRPVLIRFGGDVAADNGPINRSLEALVGAGCVVRFSTDEEMALSAYGYDGYWRGSFDVPLSQLMR